MTKSLGIFHVTCGSIAAANSSLVYSDNQLITFGAKNGIWHASIEQTPDLVASLIVRHADHPDAEPNTPIESKVNVGTGMVCFCDTKVAVPDDLSHGIICRAGFGNGAYPLTVAWDGDQAIAARMVFIDAA